LAYPNLVIIGAPKAGTTSVFNWLALHSEVCVSSVKETYHFFVRDEEVNGIKAFTEDDFVNYQTYFKNCNNSKIICEATPEYLYSQSAIHAFKKINNGCKFLFITRDPAERIYSEYIFHRYKTKRFKGDFSTYVGYENGYFSGKKVKYGFYKNYLQNWIDAFGNDRIIQMEFDDLKSDSIDFMKSLSEKIGIDPNEFNQINLGQKNKSVKIKNRKLHLALIAVANRVPKSIVELLSPIYYKLNSGSVPKKTREEQELINQLKSYYNKEIAI